LRASTESQLRDGLEILLLRALCGKKIRIPLDLEHTIFVVKNPD